jgi:hypothetical protein
VKALLTNIVGETVGDQVGDIVGLCVGSLFGAFVGDIVGVLVGSLLLLLLHPSSDHKPDLDISSQNGRDLPHFEDFVDFPAFVNHCRSHK